MRLAERLYNAEAYKSLRHKIPTETLRERGLEYVTEPPSSLQPRWLQYVTDPQWLKIETWLQLANALAPVSDGEPLDESAGGLPFVNFGIRGYRIVERDRLCALLQRVQNVLDAVIAQTRPAGIEHVEPDPFRLFVSALDDADPTRIRRCSACTRYFYSRRKDQIACSGRCANAERQRRFRERRRVYENNRKRNRAARKARAELHKSRQLR